MTGNESVRTRGVYTRKQVAELVGVTERTLHRWDKAGAPLRSFKQSSDWRTRCVYDRAEVDAFVRRAGRRRRRGLAWPRLRFERPPLDVVTVSILQMWKDDVPVEEIRRKADIALAHVERLDRLQYELNGGGPSSDPDDAGDGRSSAGESSAPREAAA